MIVQFWKSEVHTVAAGLSVHLLEDPGQGPLPRFPSCRGPSASLGLRAHLCDSCNRDLFDPEPPACFRRTLVSEPTWIVSPCRDPSAKSLWGHGEGRACGRWELGCVRGGGAAYDSGSRMARQLRANVSPNSVLRCTADAVFPALAYNANTDADFPR